MVQMRMGHDNPFYGAEIDSHSKERLDLIIALADQTCVNKREVLRGRISHDVDMGVGNEFVLPRDERDTFDDLSHTNLLARDLLGST